MAGAKNKPRFKVGDRVRFQLGRGKAYGKIKEDRGNLGVDGRRLYIVDVYLDPDDPEPSVRPEEALEPDLESENGTIVIDKSEILEFLKWGGLFAILNTNNYGEKNPPRVWLCRDGLNNLTYTFFPERGVVGGAIAPERTLNWKCKVLPAKQEAVIGYLASFGLDRQEADEAIQTMNTDP